MSASRIFKSGFVQSEGSPLWVVIRTVSGRAIRGVIHALESEVFVQVRCDLTTTDSRTQEVTILKGQSEWVCVMLDKIESVSLSWT